MLLCVPPYEYSLFEKIKSSLSHATIPMSATKGMSNHEPRSKQCLSSLVDGCHLGIVPGRREKFVTCNHNFLCCVAHP